MTRVATLVLGMHRSGTSLAAGLLTTLGLTPPRTLIPADPNNAKGYFESSPIRLFNDRLLRAAGTTWDACTPVDAAWPADPEAHSSEKEARGLLRAEFGDSQRFVLKDPRMCRLVPFWRRVLEADGVAVEAVLVWRHPLEVARSLNVRDGLSQTFSLLAWLRHVLDAELFTRSVARTFVYYPDIIADWQRVAREMARDLGRDWPRPLTDAAPAATLLVAPGLRHHAAETVDAGSFEGVPAALAVWVRSTVAALEGLDASTPSARDALDTVRAAFHPATAVVGRAQEVHNLAALDALQAAIDSAAARDRELTAIVADARARADTLDRALAASRFEAEALQSSMSWRVTAPLRRIYRLLK